MEAVGLIRILMVEDHPVFSEGMKLILDSQPDMRLVAQASTAEAGFREFQTHRPDVTLLDERLTGSSGTDLAIRIKQALPAARLVMLTTSESDGEIRRALKAGISAYLLKLTPSKDLLAVIRSVHLGKNHIPPNVAERLAEHRGCEDLTPREREVIRHIRDGFSNRRIAEQLNIAEATVNFHIRNCVGKLGANDRTHAVIVALRRGLIEL